jgi:ribonuclease HI
VATFDMPERFSRQWVARKVPQMDATEFHAMFHEAATRDWDEEELRQLARMWSETSGAAELESLGGGLERLEGAVDEGGRSMTPLRLYTDGSCAAPGAVGGWAWILVSEHVIASGSGATPGASTHQAAEVIAAIEGLASLVESGVREVELVSDSWYLVGGMSSYGRTGWAHAAAADEWRTRRRKPIKNRDAWERLLELGGCLEVTWRHVRGHRPKYDTSDDAHYNREVDVLAGEARLGFVVPASQMGASLPRTTTTRTKSPAKAAQAAKSWRELPKARKAAHLLATPTISDAAWTDEKRLPGESRTAFVGRVLKVPVTPSS